MAYNVKILADSLAPSGCRLTTFEGTYPRCIHSEMLTHREFSRCSGSSRALSVKKMIENVEKDPFIPIYWGKNQKGMQAEQEISSTEKEVAITEWLFSRDNAVKSVKSLLDLDLHKQIANRILEPWMWITVIISATTYENFFKLRCHSAAQPEMRKIAEMMRDEYNKSIPTIVNLGDWHLPLIFEEDADLDIELKKKLSIARCARVSYLNHDGKRDIQADLDLFDRLVSNFHLSPTEHVAQALAIPERNGNFEGWKQYRKFIPTESGREEKLQIKVWEDVY